MPTSRLVLWCLPVPTLYGRPHLRLSVCRGHRCRIHSPTHFYSCNYSRPTSFPSFPTLLPLPHLISSVPFLNLHLFLLLPSILFQFYSHFFVKKRQQTRALVSRSNLRTMSTSSNGSDASTVLLLSGLLAAAYVLMNLRLLYVYINNNY